MQYIKFITKLQRDQASIVRIKKALTDMDIIYLDTTRTCAKWLASELRNTDYATIHHSFFNQGDSEELLIIEDLVATDFLQKLEKPLSLIIRQWRDIDSPDNYIAILQL